MPFDGFFTHAMVHELAPILETGRVSRLDQPYPAELILTIRAHRHNKKLLLSANPTYPRMQLTSIPFKNPDVPTKFTMTLRKYLNGAILSHIEQIGNDRIIKLTFDTRDEIGDAKQLHLYIEIMARHSNITLVNPENGKILDCIKHVGSDQNRVRLLMPGATFRMPPKQDRVNPYLPNQNYTDLVPQYPDTNDLAHALQQTYQGLARPTAVAFAKKLQAGSDNLPQAYQEFIQAFDHPQPVIIKPAKGKMQFAAFPAVDDKEEELTHFDSLSAMLDQFYAGKAEADRTKELAGNVLQVLHNELKKDKRKVKKLNKQLDAAKDADQYRIRGEILTTYLGKLKQGMTSITLPNFYDDNKPLKIKLSNQLSPSRNAQKYFTRYDKLKKSVAYVNQQLKLTNEEIDYFNNIESQLELGSPSDVREIKLELTQQGYLKKKQKPGKKRRKVKISKPEAFKTSSGTEVLVGKNNLQNDRLSFKIANKNDIWLHVQGMPGSHVVLRSAHPSDQDLLEAAELAAYFSKGRHSDHVPVQYLPVKKLHKPSGAKPGFVTFRGQTTIRVTPHLIGNK